ncbi:MAG: hypothetical protein C3F02_02970 [Parcubacteria group bacterium]|nr:MAG: hypothetical protein C3F02_02970 [Parcubacteria group bacterium]
MKKIYVILIILIFGVSFWYYHRQAGSIVKIDMPPAHDFLDFSTSTVGTDTASNTATSVVPLVNLDFPAPEPSQTEVKDVLTEKKSINLDVPFTSQAPTANWAEPFQNACEEASVLMVDYYFSNKDFPSQPETENILVNLVQWQIENWGGHNNLPVAKVAEFARLNFSLRAEVVSDLTADKIRNYLDKGLPVIVPADGQELDNPNFRNGGPEYHMLVIKGYVDDKFITDDPGTRKGHDFVYTENNLMSSIHDWDTIQNKASGPSVGLILRRK